MIILCIDHSLWFVLWLKESLNLVVIFLSQWNGKYGGEKNHKSDTNENVSLHTNIVTHTHTLRCSSVLDCLTISHSSKW